MISDNKFNVDFTFEILKGCKWSCSGCQVDKNIQQDLNDANINALHKFLDDLEQNHFKLLNFNLGPTDLFDSANMHQALKAAAKIAPRFKSVTINTTLLGHHNYKELAELLDQTFPEMPMKIGVPVEPDHIKKDKYRNIIISNRDELVKSFKSVKYQKTYLTCNLHRYKHIERNFREYSENFEKLTNNHLNIIVTEGRLDQEVDINKQTLSEALDYYNSLFDRNMREHTDFSIIDFTYANDHEGHDWDLFYRNGQIYFPPFIGEPLAIFHDKFSIGKSNQWSALRLLQLRQELILESIDYTSSIECDKCQFLDKCTARRLPNLMKFLGRTDCLAPKKGYEIHATNLKSK